MTRPVLFTASPRQQTILGDAAKSTIAAHGEALRLQGVFDALLAVAVPEGIQLGNGTDYDYRSGQLLGPEPKDENGVSPDAEVVV